MRRPSIPLSPSPAIPRAPLDPLRRHLGRVPRIIRGVLGGLDLRGTCSIRGAVALSDIAAMHAAGFGDAEIVRAVALGTRADTRNQRAA